MPATKRRRRPIVEEIVEVKEPVRTAPVKEEFVETVKEVASYDEPPMDKSTQTPIFVPPVAAAPTPTMPQPVAHASEAAAREFLSEMNGNGRSRKKPNIKFIFVVTILTALVVGFVAGGIYVYISGVNGSHDTIIKASPTPAPEVTQTPSPSPTPIKLDSLTVNVLNGSGVIGAAGKVKDSLTAGGFTVTGTGNAANYNFAKTTIQVKASLPSSVLDELKTALSTYSVAVGDNLPESSKFDIVVTAGKQ